MSQRSRWRTSSRTGPPGELAVIIADSDVLIDGLRGKGESVPRVAQETEHDQVAPWVGLRWSEPRSEW
jgi:hypothetical protein